MVTEPKVQGGSDKKDLWQLLDEGVFQAYFQQSILIKTNTSPFLGGGGGAKCVYMCIVFIVTNYILNYEILQKYFKHRRK